MMTDILHEHSTLIIALGYLALELVALAAAVHAVMNVRTAQGAIAWMLALVTLPMIALPLYAVFGRRRFMGYVAARRAGDAAISHLTAQLAEEAREPFRSSLDSDSRRYQGFETIAGTPFLAANDAELLIDGQATFEAIFSALAQAREYVLVQFYIVRDDELGTQFQTALLDCLARGVRVYFLYDRIGSHQLSSRYTHALREAGAEVLAFTSMTRRVRKLQVNFRNHRKIVVADGTLSFVGGLNVGDEYVGEDPVLTPWRDTHLRIRGPAAMMVQVPFLEDWYWSSGALPRVRWQAEAMPADHTILSLPSSPTDDREPGALMFVHAIHSARQRLWIVSPYFVPNGSIIDGLKMAALRGVDVRILIPGVTDNRLVALAGHAYLPELATSGVRFFRYEKGFLHQKVMLIDGDMATVGTANLDNRSMRLNFEHTMVLADERLAADVERMLKADLANSSEIFAEELAQDPWWKNAAARSARLLAPVL
jgi:cardiolipin synthase